MVSSLDLESNSLLLDVTFYHCPSKVSMPVVSLMPSVLGLAPYDTSFVSGKIRWWCHVTSWERNDHPCCCHHCLPSHPIWIAVLKRVTTPPKDRLVPDEWRFGYLYHADMCFSAWPWWLLHDFNPPYVGVWNTNSCKHFWLESKVSLLINLSLLAESKSHADFHSRILMQISCAFPLLLFSVNKTERDEIKHDGFTCHFHHHRLDPGASYVKSGQDPFELHYLFHLPFHSLIPCPFQYTTIAIHVWLDKGIPKAFRMISRFRL